MDRVHAAETDSLPEHRRTVARTELVSVLIADDHAMVAEGLTRLLQDAFDVVGCVSDGEALVDTATRLRPDVIVADISMPGLNGLQAIERLAAIGVESRVIMLSMYSDATLVQTALRMGARGYVLKQSAGDELVLAIREALAGHVHVSRQVRAQIATAPPAARMQLPVELTMRQREVLQLVAKGLRTQHIAEMLRVSPRTIEAHRYEIMQALGVHSTVELVSHAIRLGLVSV